MSWHFYDERDRFDDYGGYGGFGYDTSHVKPDEAKPRITTYVEKGNLQAVKNIVESATTDEAKNKVLNYARRWTEVDYKDSGFTKEHDWFDLTPLATAARRGHDDIVQYLLEQGADPTLEGCPEENVYLNALEAATKNTLSGSRCFDLLSVANLFWKKAAYSGIWYSETARSVFSNRPTNMKRLQEALNEVPDIKMYPRRLKKDLKSIDTKYTQKNLEEDDSKSKETSNSSIKAKRPSSRDGMEKCSRPLVHEEACPTKKARLK